MTSLKNLQATVHTTYLSANRNSTDFDTIHASIYNLVLHAFMSDVLTLSRMNSVIHTVQEGLNDFATIKNHLTSNMRPMAQRSAYRGLCNAACEGLAAVGLAHAEFIKRARFSTSANFNNVLAHETLQLKRQLDKITVLSDWQSEFDIKNIQIQWLKQLSIPTTTNLAQGEKSNLSWSDQFFQTCEFKAIKSSENLDAGFMLLGLFTSGVLAGMQIYQTTI